jgi:hypothetical protein
MLGCKDTQALVKRSEADKVKFSTDQFEKYITGTVSRFSNVCSMGYKFAARFVTLIETRNCK